MDGLPSGATQLGAYRIEATLGQGGMGEVFLAWDERLHRHVALKRIRPELLGDEHHRARFRREARAAARLNHPAIVQIYDLLETEQGDWLVMEHVEGRGLEDLIAARELDAQLVLRLGEEIADGLAEAHAKGLVHRDLKPANVRVTPSGHAKILDFGLARLLWRATDAEDSGARELTRDGALVGTLHAMSPEQAGGLPMDHRSDLFALGGLLYEMLSGKAPFRGRNWLDTLRRVTSEEPESLARLCPGLPPEVVALVAQLLAKQPAARPQNARLVADALARLHAAQAVSVLAQGPPAAGQPLLATTDPSGPAEVADLPTGEWLGASAEPASESTTAVRTLLRVLLVGRDDLLARHGDASMAGLLGRHDRGLRELMAQHGGLEVEAGDGALGLFARPVDAVACALAHHRQVVALAAESRFELRARAAVHLGEVVLRQNPPSEVSRGARALEVEGLAKAVVARLLSLAGPGQTLTTQGAFDLARRAAVGHMDEGGDGLRWLAHGRYVFASSAAFGSGSGGAGPARAPEDSASAAGDILEVFEIGVPGLAPLAPPADSAQARRMTAPSEELVLGWRPAAGQAIPRRDLWRLEQRLGEGGFGEVWLARHKSGERRVFKFCFEAERLRALKREVTLFRLLKEVLGHRNDIARILDWSFDVAPYFVESEYTEGGNLVQWAAEQGGLEVVPMETRLELVAQIAEALAAAHSVGVLHKDVKPENVLITRDPEGLPRARLTDFGVGLLTDRGRLAAEGVTALGFTATISTDQGSAGGTLAYQAPELVAGQPPTLQADVYSLGVVLFQMLVTDFSRPVAPGWERDVADELLAEDLATFLDGQPARRPSHVGEVAVRLRTLQARREERAAQRRAVQEAAAARQALERALQRRKIALGMAIVALVVLAVVLLFAERERRARQAASRAAEQARQDAEVARRVSQFMQELFEDPDPFRGGDSELTARAILDRATARIGEQLADQPEVQATLLQTMGGVYTNLGHFATASRFLRESLAIRRRIFGDSNPEAWETRFAQGKVLCFQGAYASGVATMAMALAALDSEPREPAVQVRQLNIYGSCLRLVGRYATAERVLADAEALGERTWGSDDPRVVESRHMLATVLVSRGRIDEAATLMSEILARVHRRNPGSVEEAVLRLNLAQMLWYRGDMAGAAALVEEAAPALKAALGAQHPVALAAAVVRGMVLHGLGDLDAAEEQLRSTLKLQQQGAEASRSTASVLVHLAWVLRDRGDCIAAEPLIRQALAILATGPRNPEGTGDLGLAQGLFGSCELLAGRYSTARIWLTRGYKLLHQHDSDHAPSTQAVERWLRESAHSPGEPAD